MYTDEKAEATGPAGRKAAEWSVVTIESTRGAL